MPAGAAGRGAAAGSQCNDPGLLEHPELAVALLEEILNAE